MNSAYIILGYGVPADILKDRNYTTYLTVALNRVYEEAAGKRAAIIFSGGPTDMRKPYKRTEAEEMVRFTKAWIAEHTALKTATKKWKLAAERKALSSLENLLFAKAWIQKQTTPVDRITIFCEYVRGPRIEKIARKILGKVRVVPVDFDASSNRYLDPSFLAKKEAIEIAHSLWALKNNENRKKHHKLFEEKLAMLRKIGPKKHEEAVREWWKRAMVKFEKL